MLTLDGTASARAAASVAGLHYLIDLDFSTGFIYRTTHAIDIVANGHTYVATGDVLQVADIAESEDSQGDRFVVSVSLVNTAMLATLIGDAAVYRNRAIQIWAQLIDDTFQPAGVPVLRRRGYMDRVVVERTPAPPGGGPAGGAINLECTRAGMARLRNASGLRRTHAQQMQRTGGADTGLRYTQQLIEQPTLWLSKRFQQV